jgi:glycosyltransferase involved in cell wall biosynthesis
LSDQHKPTPLVSVILPTYNRASLVGRAIQSIIHQDFQDFEIILIDDGSTDGTPRLFKDLPDARINYIRLDENRGIGVARHTGLNYARGDYIAFLDADDIWLEGKLLLQLRAFDLFPRIELIFGNYVNINQVLGTQELGFTQTEHGVRQMQVSLLSQELEFWQVQGGQAEALLTANFYATPTVMFRRGILEKTGSFNQALSGPEDFEFWWRAAVKGVVTGYTLRPLIERYKDQESISTQTITFAPRYLSALDICQRTALECNRMDLIQPLDHARQRVWCGLIHDYALMGKRRPALDAFRHSLEHGSSGQAWLYLLAALAGPHTIQMVQRLSKGWAGDHP